MSYRLVMSDDSQETHNFINLAVLAICQALFFSGRTLTFFGAALVAIAMLGGDLTLATAPVTAMLVGTSVSTIPAAFIMRLWGRKLGFVFGSLTGCVGALLAAYAVTIDDFLIFNIGIFLSGVYGAFGQQYRFAAAEVAPKNVKEKNVSIVIAMSVLGAFIGPETAMLAKNWVPSFPFQGTFIMLAIFYALTAVIILFARLPKLTKQEFEDEGRSLLTILKLPNFVVAVIAGLFGYVVMNFLMVVTPLTMETLKTVFFSHDNIKLVVQWHVVGMFLPGFFTGYLIKQFGVERIIMAGAVILLASVIVALQGLSFTHFLVSLILLGVGWNFTFTGSTLLVTKVHSPAERAKVQGTNDFIIFTGLALSSLMAGGIFHHFGWNWINFAMLPVILFILFSAMWLNSVRAREQVTESKKAD